MNFKNKFNLDYFSTLYEFIWFFLLFLKIKKDKKINNKKILIINSCLIGDFCSSVHFIKKFILKNKNYKIDILVEKNIIDFAKNIQDIHNVFTYEYLKNKENLKYEQIIILRANKKILSSAKNISAKKIYTNLKTFLGFGLNISKNYLLKKYPKSFLETNFNILKYKKNIYNSCEIFNKPTPKIEQKISKLTKENTIIIHTEASWIMNQWDLENWLKLIKKIKKNDNNYNFIFIGGGDKEQKTFDKFSKKLDFEIYSAIKKLSLFELLILIKKSKFFIGVDSGPANISYLTNIKSITLGGPGPHLFLPYRNNKIFIDKSNKRNFLERFFYKKKKLINKITINEVYKNFINLKNK